MIYPCWGGCGATCEAEIPDELEAKCGFIHLNIFYGVGYWESKGRHFCSWTCVESWARRQAQVEQQDQLRSVG